MKSGLCILLACGIVFSLCGCERKSDGKKPAVSKSSESSIAQDETGVTPGTLSSGDAPSSASDRSDTNSSSSSRNGNTSKQSGANPGNATSTKQPEPQKTYHTAWGTRPLEFKESYSEPIFEKIYYHYDLYYNEWYDKEEHSDGFGKDIFAGGPREGDENGGSSLSYFGNGHWALWDGSGLDVDVYYVWGEYDFTQPKEIEVPYPEKLSGFFPFDTSHVESVYLPKKMPEGGLVGYAYDLLRVAQGRGLGGLPVKDAIDRLNSGDIATYDYSADEFRSIGLEKIVSPSEFLPRSTYKAPNRKS